MRENLVIDRDLEEKTQKLKNKFHTCFKWVHLLFTLDFRSGFKRLVEEYGQVVTEKINECLRLRHNIENRNSSLDFKKEIFRNIVNQINLQGRSADVTDKIMEEIEEKQPFRDGKIGWFPEYFLDEEASGIKFLDKFADRKKEKIIEISNQLRFKSVADWIINLHNLRQRGQTVMGPKSDDDFLKEHGYFDRVPIDVHSQRFLFRIGILHYYSEKYQPNPSKFFSTNYNEKYESFQKALVSFCRDFLSGIEIGGFDLAKNPGIVDLIIWRHCAESEEYHCKNICGDQPKCHRCCLKDSCLQYLLEVKRHFK